jgi:uncharacterized protein (DUF362 family)
MTKPALGRRGILRGLAATSAMATPLAAAAHALAIPGPQPGPRSRPSKPVVAIARREGLLREAAFDAAKLQDALGAVVARAASEAGPVEAFRRLFKPTDVVGIKLNCIAGRGLSPRPEVALQLAAWLQAAGIAPEHIVIWDRTERELREAGYTPNAGRGVRVIGTDGDYEASPRSWGPESSRFARLLAEEMTALIDLAVLKDHNLPGVSLSMKNWYGAIHNPSRLHAEGCNPFIPHLAASPLIRGKLRLTVVDGSLGQCHAGPSRSPRWIWPYSGFVASTDPVALDSVGWRILEARRKEVGLPTLAAEGREPRFIAAAEKLGLGVAEASRIETAEV